MEPDNGEVKVVAGVPPDVPAERYVSSISELTTFVDSFDPESITSPRDLIGIVKRNSRKISIVFRGGGRVQKSVVQVSNENLGIYYTTLKGKSMQGELRHDSSSVSISVANNGFTENGSPKGGFEIVLPDGLSAFSLGIESHLLVLYDENGYKTKTLQTSAEMPLEDAKLFANKYKEAVSKLLEAAPNKEPIDSPTI